MKRWSIALIVAVLSCVPVFLNRSTSPALFQDTDTMVLLRTIRERNAPMSWFTSDWPLENHFYRPISTLAFEADNRLYGENAAGFGMTNALLCCLCVLLAAWLWRELTDSVGLTAFATALFGLWHWNGAGLFLGYIPWLAGAVALLGLFRHGFKIKWWLPAVGALWYLANELEGVKPLSRVVDWLPGRTASVMTIFCLIAMAAYARYERTSARQKPPKPTALDEPATKSTVQETRSPRWPWIWAVIAVVASALALGSYEQAVMLPTALFGVAVSLRLRRYRVRWGWQIAFWGLLVAYYFARHAFIPAGTSSYQAQQFRHGPGVLLDLVDYLFPSLNVLHMTAQTFDVGWMILLTDKIYLTVAEVAGNVFSVLAAYRHWVLALTGWALAFFAFLPMAWLNYFPHYHYWPMALRALYVAVVAWGTWELCVIAVSPPARQAPRRPSPAPGSLPRP